MDRLIRSARGSGCALLLAVMWACGAQPSGPTPVSVAGTYSLAFVPCSFSSTPAASIAFVCSAQNVWTVTQSAAYVTGANGGACPPFNYSGTLAGTVSSSNRVEISALSYTDASSHTSIRTITGGTGEASVDNTGFSGMIVGDYSETPVAGGAIVGPTQTCHGAQMAFHFIRQP